MRMRILIGIALLTPMAAYAGDEAHPEELFLGDHSWLQDKAELQVTALPAWAKERWDMGVAVEYGITRRVQLSLEGDWSDGPNMDVLREVELGAQFGLLRNEHWAFAIGGNVTAEMTDETELGFEPAASLSFSLGSIGANLAASGAVASDIEPCVSLAVFARVGPVIPLVEAGYMDGEMVGRGGLAVQLGSAQLAAAFGYGADMGASVHAALTWEMNFLGDDDDEDDEAP
jgi:hypothetical protein